MHNLDLLQFAAAIFVERPVNTHKKAKFIRAVGKLCDCHTCTHRCVHVRVRTHAPLRGRTNARTDTRGFACSLTSTELHACARAHARARTRVRVHTHTHARAHARTHARTHTLLTHTKVWSRWASSFSFSTRIAEASFRPVRVHACESANKRASVNGDYS